jgi:hypothetical protein
MTTPFADHSAVCRSQHCEMNMRGRWVTIIVAHVSIHAPVSHRSNRA